MRSTSVGGERNILYKGVETSPYQTCFKNLEGKPERESSKRTISAKQWACAITNGIRARHRAICQREG